MTNPLREGLPHLPDHMRELAVDERGYPVPFFVAWIDSTPDHRVADARAMAWCMEHNACWICGNPLGRFKAFTIGPMCVVTRTISEPPQHLDCAEFAAKSCPFLTRPRAKRRDANLPAGLVPPAGNPLLRNPGAVCVWVTTDFRPWRQPDGRWLFRLVGPPVSMKFYAEGRPATRAEVIESVESGLPLLRDVARQDGQAGEEELDLRIADALAFIDAALPAPIAEDL